MDRRLSWSRQSSTFNVTVHQLRHQPYKAELSRASILGHSVDNAAEVYSCFWADYYFKIEEAKEIKRASR